MQVYGNVYQFNGSHVYGNVYEAALPALVVPGNGAWHMMVMLPVLMEEDAIAGMELFVLDRAFCVEAMEVFTPGSETSRVFSPGEKHRHVFTPGATESEVCP